MNTDPSAEPFWARPVPSVMASLGADLDGLAVAEAESRSDGRQGGFHSAPAHTAAWRLAVRQVENPIVLLLIGATALSMALGDVVDGVIILVITVASATLGFIQERGAVRAVETLLATVRVRTAVRRSGHDNDVDLDDVVLGDILVLRAGDVIAGDALVLVSDALLLDESTLTGESFPAEKQPGTVDAATPLPRRTNAVWCGTHVVSGSGLALVVATGTLTEFGRVGERLAGGHVPTAFELGLRKFGYLLMRTAGVLVAAIFVINLALDRPWLESLLFSLALAVGLTPQLLPTIVTVTLAHGAREMARRHVIVKRLDAIEDIGAIDVLCTDKTGTLTAGAVHLDRAIGPDGAVSSRVQLLAWVNASGQQDFANPIDDAILAEAAPEGHTVTILEVLPYDFTRRLFSVLAEIDGTPTLVCKGAVAELLARCDLDPESVARHTIRFETLSTEGFRVLCVGSRPFHLDPTAESPPVLTKADEQNLVFAGFLCFFDPPKPGASEAIATLRQMGVATILITGDNRHAAAHAARAVGLDLGDSEMTQIITGDVLAGLDEGAFREAVAQAAVFAEIDPLQKEMIVTELRRSGKSVGYLGDGINDAPSLRAADVGISVDTAVDVAKHSASVVLLQKDLSVLADGIRLGRQVFANTLKYVQVTISANFGNMVSMAAAAAVLPFLPLLPRQILLLNFLSDIPGMAIAADRVDPEDVSDPHGWDLHRLRNFMITFGLISSVFDVATFTVLRAGFGASPELFRTGWFLESTATELAVMLVLRTRRSAWKSRPGTALVTASAAVAVLTIALPFTSLAGDLGFTHLTAGVLIALAALTVAYVLTTETAKRWLVTKAPSGRFSAGVEGVRRSRRVH